MNGVGVSVGKASDEGSLCHGGTDGERRGTYPRSTDRLLERVGSGVGGDEVGLGVAVARSGAW